MITYILAIFLSLNNVTLKVSGLACSICSLNAKKNIEKVYFVDKVNVDIEDVTFNIEFKKDHYVDFFAIQNAVEGKEIGTLQNAIVERFETLDEQQRNTVASMAKLEASFVRQFLSLGK